MCSLPYTGSGAPLPRLVRLFAIVIPLLLSAVPLPCQGEARSTGGRLMVSVSLPFIANLGQIEEDVAFYAVNGDCTVFVSSTGEIIYVIAGEGGTGRVVLREDLLDRRRNAVKGVSRTATLVNWYKESDPARWRQNLPVFQSVSFGSAYDNIDVSLVARREGIEKLFTIYPGGDVSEIRFRVDGARSLGKNGSGALVAATPQGQVLFTKPSAYQLTGGIKKEIPVSYTVDGDEYGFIVGDFDRALPLTIDPLFASSYIGGKGNETAYVVEVYDDDVFMAGTADSPDFPGSGEGAGRLGDAFVVRLNRDLSTIRAATFIGGSLTEGARDMVVDAAGVFVAGYSESLDFPTTPGSAYAASVLSGAFISRLDTNTLQMTASTTFYPNLFAITLGPGGGVYVGGATVDPSFPLVSRNPYQANLQGGADSFIAGFTGDLQAIEFSTLFGGEGVDIIYDLAADPGGEILASGVTNSTAFPVSDSAFDATYNLDWEQTLPWRDGFVARFSADLSELLASTYLGGGVNDSILALIPDGSDVIVGGNTTSIDFPCGNTFGPVDGNDAFIFRFDRTLSTVRSCAVFGGGESGKISPDTVTDIALSSDGEVLATGRTDADNFPTTSGAFLERPSGSYTGGFITSFTPDLAHIVASTLVYGDNEYLHSIALGTDQDLFVAGDAQSGGYLVTQGSIQVVPGGGDDLIVSRFSLDLTGPHVELDPDTIDFGKVPKGKSETGTITIYNTGGAELHIQELTFLPASLSPFTLEGKCSVVPAFSSCPVKVVFTPSKPGSVEGTLLVFSDDLFNRQKDVSLRGRGVAGPAIDVNPDVLFFRSAIPGEIPAVQKVSVINVGSGELRIRELILGGQDPSSFLLRDEQCTKNPLPGGTECGITIQFVPSGEEKRAAMLRIVSNDPVIPVYQVYLEGRGAASHITEILPGSDGENHSSQATDEEDNGGLSIPVGALGALLLCVVLWLAVRYSKKMRFPFKR